MKLGDIEIKSNSQFLKLEEGANKIRLVSEFIIREVTFPGSEKPSQRYCAWVIDRKSNELRMAEFGKQIMKQLKTLCSNPDYAFDVVPEYDITINRAGSGIETEYSVVPDRKDTPITEDEQKLIDALEKPSEFYQKFTEKKELTPEDLPF